jgi:YggT family protein
MSGFISVGYFLFSLFFSLIIFILWVRLALRYFRISSLHPLSQVINRLTEPVVYPFTKMLAFTSKINYLRRYDWACFVVLCLVEIIKFITLGWFLLGVMLPWFTILIYTLADLIVQPCDLLFYAILIRVIMSWINPRWQHPIADLLRIVTDPLLRAIGRFVPVISGLDFSPFIALILLKVITIFINASLPLHM